MTARVKLEITIPETREAVTQDHIKEWVEFQLGCSATLSGTNPLVNHDIDGYVDYCSVDTRPF